VGGRWKNEIGALVYPADWMPWDEFLSVLNCRDCNSNAEAQNLRISCLLAYQRTYCHSHTALGDSSKPGPEKRHDIIGQFIGPCRIVRARSYVSCADWLLAGRPKCISIASANLTFA
jgi:hypothetical protein